MCEKKNSNNIKCFAIYIDLNNIYWPLNNIIIKIIQLENDYQLLYSYQEDNCNFTIYNSEYLVCCGKKDFIFCDRRDMDFNLINDFNITLQGKISNLTFENTTEYITLIYSNKKDDKSNIFEYFIYPPICKNIQVSMNSYQIIKVNISNLFERKTNTNRNKRQGFYYIFLLF